LVAVDDSTLQATAAFGQKRLSANGRYRAERQRDELEVSMKLSLAFDAVGH